MKHSVIEKVKLPHDTIRGFGYPRIFTEVRPDDYRVLLVINYIPEEVKAFLIKPKNCDEVELLTEVAGQYVNMNECDMDLMDKLFSRLEEPDWADSQIDISEPLVEPFDGVVFCGMVV